MNKKIDQICKFLWIKGKIAQAQYLRSLILGKESEIFQLRRRVKDAEADARIAWRALDARKTEDQHRQ